MTDTALTIPARTSTSGEITPQGIVPVPSIGDQVLFVLDTGHSAGESRPAIVTRTFAEKTGMVNLQVLTDALNDFSAGDPGCTGIMWKTAVPYSETGERGTWRYGTPSYTITG
jgi:hypothetical protein